jgi:signal transduction histidine kinase
LHSQLARQLRKLGLSLEHPPAGPEEWGALLGRINNSFEMNDQSRYLLERSLMLSSEEMQLLYRRQRAITECSQVLLFNRDDKAVDTALEILLRSTAGLCGAVDIASLNKGAEPTWERRWEHCFEGGIGHLPVPPSRRDENAELCEGLSSGRVIVSEGIECGPNGTPCSVAQVPITDGSRWIATLAVCAPDPTGWAAPDIDFLRIGAEMIGAFIVQQMAREQLVSLARSKDQLIASVSHELRTPLTVVVGLADELNQGLDRFSATERTELVTLMARQSHDVADIVEDLLVAARASVGDIVIDRNGVEIFDEVRRVIDDQTALHFDREVTIEISGEQAVVVADAARVRQILRNLITNAARYGGSHITVSVHSSEREVTVEVRDNGSGIPAAFEARVFEPFARAHIERGQPNSVGIGLTVSLELAQLMDGDLAYRRENSDTVFALTLPAWHSATPGEAPTAAISEAAATT